MTDRIIWHNGDLAPASEGRIQPEDRGLLFGEGAFETLRVYGGRPFRLDAHLERLASALRVMEISVPKLAERLRQGVDDTLAANALANAWVRITVTAGTEDGAPNLIVAAMPLPALPPAWYAGGVAVAMATSRFVREPASVLSGLKSTNYLVSRLARKEAQARGAHEAIFLNTHGRLAEGASSNIFLVEDGALITPARDEGILAGITRRTVLELAKETGVAFAERAVERSELDAADEVFITSSLREVLPVCSVDGHKIAGGGMGMGPVTRKLLRAYRELAGNPEPVPE